MKKPKFVLSRKNQKGQVAIFVALIFQVIFVFFALLINVGLLVHHKINLQQSTDLAAYYGAMKQAESLNAIAHINYQIKQAWKLLTWRYRVLGTFGFENGQNEAPPYGGPTFPLFPITNGAPARVTSNPESGKCAFSGGETFNTLDLPFFCVGHNGMSGWPGQNENNCRINCKQMNQGVSSINLIKGVGSAVVGGQNFSSTANAFINAANDDLTKQCDRLGPIGMKILGRFIISYFLETKARSETLLMLASNTSQPDAEKIVDLDGNLVLDGVKKTLKNNLTEANATSISDSKIKILNGLSNNDCSMSTDPNSSGKKSLDGQFLKRIEFAVIQFYIHKCKKNGTATDYSPASIFANINAMNPELDISNPDIADIILSLNNNDNRKFTVGYEKNPWCQSYYAVKAETEPKIPFLPLSKIKLTAVSTAKPFGGSIGPWFGKEWKAGAKNSQDDVGVDQSKQTDPTLPLMAFPTDSSLKNNAKVLMNFGRFVGDNKGLTDGSYVAEYHAALIDRTLSTKVPELGSSSKFVDGGSGGKLNSVNAHWPALNSWDNTTAVDMGVPGYDPLTTDNGNDSFLRDLEISAISPNQFDVTYYSIDPDFYNNYYLRLSNPAIFSKIKAAAGIGPYSVQSVRADFGNNDKVYTQRKAFGVRNQIQIVAKVFNAPAGAGVTGAASNFLSQYKELATRQSSLLTGWTFANFSDFNKFPDADVTTPDGSMSFGRCKDADWQGTYDSPKYDTPVEFNSALPPTPGNCVTGGRVGYSVKLVSPSMLRSNAPPQPLGGPNTNGPLKNPIPEEFFSF